MELFCYHQSTVEVGISNPHTRGDYLINDTWHLLNMHHIETPISSCNFFFSIWLWENIVHKNYFDKVHFFEFNQNFVVKINFNPMGFVELVGNLIRKAWMQVWMPQLHFTNYLWGLAVYLFWSLLGYGGEFAGVFGPKAGGFQDTIWETQKKEK